MNDSTVSRDRSVYALVKIGIILVIALVAAMLAAPLVFRITQQIPFLAQYPFRRVFDRVILVTVVGGIAIGWRWIGLSFNFRRLYRLKRAPGKFLFWFVVGVLCITFLIYAQAYADLRIARDRTFGYMLGKAFGALMSAIAVALLEESIFRGYVLQAFRQRYTVFKAIMISSALFALLHVFSLDYFLKPIKVAAEQLNGYDWLAGCKLIVLFFEPLKSPLTVLPGLIGLFLAAWLLAELTVRTKALWAAIGLHAGWVFAIKFWGRLWKFPSDTSPDWFYGDSYAATGVIGWIVVGFLILCVTGLVGYVIYRIATVGVMLLPHRTALTCGRFVGRVMYLFAIPHKRLALENIRQAFPDKTEKECRAIARQSFETMGMVFLEFLQFQKLHRQHQEFLVMIGEEYIEQARTEGKGIIYFTGHFCSWEMLVLQCSVKHYPFSAIARPFNNTWIYRHIQKIRTQGGIAVLDKRNSVRDILHCLRHNGMAGFVADQYAGSKGLFVDFFGRPASTTAAVATLSRKTGAAIIPAFNHMYEDGRHETILYPAIHVPKTDNAAKDIFDTTQKLMAILENEIRQQPGRYLWAHRKWRAKKH